MKYRVSLIAAGLVVVGFVAIRFRGVDRTTSGSKSLEPRTDAVTALARARSPAQEAVVGPDTATLRGVGASRARAYTAAGASSVSTNQTILQRLLAQDESVGRVPPEQIEAYLALNKTNSGSLLAAWQAAGDREFLKRASILYPDDPRVQLSVIALDVYPEEQRQWLDRFKQSAPDNALANYFSARDYLRSGQTELAMKELADAAGKTRFNDYTLEKMQDLEEVQMLSGKSIAEAKAVAMSSVTLPHLKPLRELSVQLGGLQQQYISAGDAASATAVARLGWNLGQQLSAGEGARCLVNQMVGLAVERNVLTPLPPDSQPDFLQRPVKDQLDAMTAQREAARTLAPLFDQLIARGSEVEIISFFDRMKLYGEYAALAWLRDRQGPR